jgi:hypothetical protein
MIVESLTRKQSPETQLFTAEFYQTLKELIPMLLKLSHKIKMKGTFPSSFYKAIITLLTKPDIDKTTKNL